MIKNMFCLVIMGSVLSSTDCFSMQSEEDDLDTRARRSMDIASNYVRAHGQIVEGDDNTPCPTLTFEAPWAKAGFATFNTSLLKNAIKSNKIPISVSVIATNPQNEEIWRTERNDKDPALAHFNYDALKRLAELRIANYRQQRGIGREIEDEDVQDDCDQQQRPEEIIPYLFPHPPSEGVYEMAFDPYTGQVGWVSQDDEDEEDRRQARRDRGWNSDSD